MFRHKIVVASCFCVLLIALGYRSLWLKNGSFYLRDLVQADDIASLDLAYIPYSVMTRIPISPENFDGVAMYRTKVDFSQKESWLTALKTLYSLRLASVPNNRLDTRWAISLYAKGNKKLLVLYGDGKGRCSLNAKSYSCNQSIDEFVNSIFIDKVRKSAR